MDTSSYKMDDLKKKYDNFFAPAFEINVNGQDLIEKLHLSIKDLNVDQSVNIEENGVASFTVVGFYEQKDTRQINKSLLTKILLPMQPVTIKTGYSLKRKEVFQGVIYERTVTVNTEDMVSCRVTCVDAKGLMRQNKRVESHMNADSKSALVTKLLQPYAKFFNKKTVESTPKFEKARTIHQFGLSDYDFITKLAQEEGMEFFVVDGELYFGPPLQSTEPILEISLEDNILEVGQTFSLTGIFTKMGIYGYNQDNNENKTAQAASVSLKVGEGKIAADYIKEAGLEVDYAQALQMNTQSEVDIAELSKTVLWQNSMLFVKLNLEIIGIPELIPGRILRLKNIAVGVNNDYYIAKVSHQINTNGYTTFLEGVSNTL